MDYKISTIQIHNHSKEYPTEHIFPLVRALSVNAEAVWNLRIQFSLALLSVGSHLLTSFFKSERTHKLSLQQLVMFFAL